VNRHLLPTVSNTQNQVDWAHAIRAHPNNPRIANKRQSSKPSLGNRGGFLSITWLLSCLATVSRRFGTVAKKILMTGLNEPNFSHEF